MRSRLNSHKRSLRNLEGTLLAHDGVICVDNTLMQGLPYLDGPMTGNGLAIAEFNRKVASDLRIERVILPLRDGLTLIGRSQQVPLEHHRLQPWPIEVGGVHFRQEFGGFAVIDARFADKRGTGTGLIGSWFCAAVGTRRGWSETPVRGKIRAD